MVLLPAVVELNLLYLPGQFYPLLFRNNSSDIKQSLEMSQRANTGSYLYCFQAFGLYGEHGKLLLLPKSSINLFEVHHVIWANEQQTETLFGGSCCSATPMDVSLRCPGDLG